jgi:hypothetical protein
MLASLLALIAAIGGGTVGVLAAAWVAGRLDLFRNRPGETFYFIWSVRSEASVKGVLWEIAAALTRAISAFGNARLVLLTFAVRPTVPFAVGLVAVLLALELSNLNLHRRGPIRIPHGVLSLHALQAVARVLAAVAVAPLVLRV